MLKIASLYTPLGEMSAIADENTLYLLEFVDRPGLEREIERLKQKTTATIAPGRTHIIDSIENELNLYFEGKLTEFKTPLSVLGSPFQQRVWEELKKIPYGKTYSYADLAKAILHPSAFRAVAKANSTNQIAIVIPCHRVINANGKLGGYAGGLPRKEWLIHHEKKNG